MLDLDSAAVDATTYAITRLARLAARHELVTAAAAAQRDKPRELLRALDKIRAAVDEVEGIWRSNLSRLGIDIDLEEKQRADRAAAVQNYAALRLQSVVSR